MTTRGSSWLSAERIARLLLPLPLVSPLTLAQRSLRQEALEMSTVSMGSLKSASLSMKYRTNVSVTRDLHSTAPGEGCKLLAARALGAGPALRFEAGLAAGDECPLLAGDAASSAAAVPAANLGPRGGGALRAEPCAPPPSCCRSEPPTQGSDRGRRGLAGTEGLGPADVGPADGLMSSSPSLRGANSPTHHKAKRMIPTRMAKVIQKLKCRFCAVATWIVIAAERLGASGREPLARAAGTCVGFVGALKLLSRAERASSPSAVASCVATGAPVIVPVLPAKLESADRSTPGPRSPAQ
mmetsp:Transcript_89760/g.249329  ORF Transcript_89760/g.249329 Transcript_89760/m.249329 type:complete len:298 (-) Transcript_89760:365-1258(-)